MVVLDYLKNIQLLLDTRRTGSAQRDMGGDQLHPDCHFAAAGIAAVINFPLWKASAIAQSGFKVQGSSAARRYFNAIMQPPYRGVVATVLGMTWARASIFYCSDYGVISLKLLSKY